MNRFSARRMQSLLVRPLRAPISASVRSVLLSSRMEAIISPGNVTRAYYSISGRVLAIGNGGRGKRGRKRIEKSGKCAGADRHEGTWQRFRVGHAVGAQSALFSWSADWRLDERQLSSKGDGPGSAITCRSQLHFNLTPNQRNYGSTAARRSPAVQVMRVLIGIAFSARF